MPQVPREAHIYAVLAAVLLVVACNGGDGASASGNSPNPSSSGNRPPTISGAPVAALRQGEIYDFRPNATDPDGDVLTFSILNKPGWASFEPATGRLRGTPAATDIGTYSNVEISVSDGRATARLAPFSIAVYQFSPGSVTLSWTPPLTNADGSALTGLAGYRIYYGQSPHALAMTVTINNAGATRWVVTNLSPATYYFAMTSFNVAGVESARSETVSRTVG